MSTPNPDTFMSGAPERELAMWGRCRSGRRWFWAARWHDQEDVPHVLCGFEDTEGDALAAGEQAAREITDGRPTHMMCRHGVADSVLKEQNAERRRARPSAGGQGAVPVEFLYSVADPGWDDPRAASFVVSHTVVRKTARRVYFAAREGGPSVRTGFVDRQTLEAAGKVFYQAGRITLYEAPPNLDRVQAPAPDMAALKQEMAAAHPDRGGTDAEFITARTVYERARARTGAAS